MKKFVGAFLLVVMVLSSTAYATENVMIGIGKYDDSSVVPFTFTNTTFTRDTASRAKGDSEQRWYITLEGDCNVSSSNILGARPRINNSAKTQAASYQTFDRKVQGESHGYYSNKVTTGTSVFLRLKKDSESTTSNELYAAGWFCP